MPSRGEGPRKALLDKHEERTSVTQRKDRRKHMIPTFTYRKVVNTATATDILLAVLKNANSNIWLSSWL